MRFFFQLSLALLFSQALGLIPLFAQNIAVGTWRTHLSYNDGRKLALADDQVYCSSVNGLFAYNKSDESIQTIGSIEGLSDSGIADLAYHEPTKTLVIAYQNGNIDLWREEEVINVRSLLNSGKENTEIRALTLEGDIAYFTTAFGGFEFNLITLAAGDTFDNIGADESQGLGMAVLNNELYLATDFGIYTISLSPSINRQDASNWVRLPIPSQAVSHIAQHDGSLYYAIPALGVYRLNGNSPVLLSVTGSAEVLSMRSTSQGLYVGTPSGLTLINGEESILIANEGVLQPNDVAFDGTTLWVADNPSGLLRITDGETRAFAPSGTLSSDAFRLFNIGNEIVAVAGGFNRLNLNALNRVARFYVFSNGEWTNYSSIVQGTEAIEIPQLSDITAAVGNSSTIYLGCYGQGILGWNRVSGEFQLDQSGPLRVTGLGQDSEGDLWACSAENGLYQKQDNRWSRVLAVSNPVELLIDRTDSKWVSLANGGLVLLNGSNSRILRHSEGQGNLRGDRVSALAVDREGSIWAGTTNGITEFFDPFFTLDGEDGSTVFTIEGLPANQGENVTAIAVDGGNRKWVGTENGGLWLYDSNGNIIENFTQDNSPLLSDQILSIAIERLTGEVFIATDRGIISYRGTATEGAITHSNVKIFPNPVPPNYIGLVSISGLVGNALVRITDSGGRLIWKGQAAGGTVSWDGRNYQGQKAKTGVYFVFSSNADGQETYAGKIAWVE